MPLMAIRLRGAGADWVISIAPFHPFFRVRVESAIAPLASFVRLSEEALVERVTRPARCWAIWCCCGSCFSPFVGLGPGIQDLENRGGIFAHGLERWAFAEEYLARLSPFAEFSSIECTKQCVLASGP